MDKRKDPDAPVSRIALVVGNVEFREGDGPMMTVPKGEIEVVTTAQDATLAWQDGPTRGSATLPLSDFRRQVERGSIRLAPPSGAGSSPDSYP